MDKLDALEIIINWSVLSDLEHVDWAFELQINQNQKKSTIFDLITALCT